jgi:protein TonB
MKPDSPPPTAPRSRWFRSGLMASIAAVIAACRSAPSPSPSVPDEAAPPGTVSHVTGPVPAAEGSARPSAAATPLAYRQDAATHLYGLNRERIFKGKLPPQLYAIGVLQLDIDRSGKITRLHWMRAPRHAPEVVTEIERTVRAAAPFPVPARMGKVTYTETWLWDKSGKFQLDTLTEGQL